MEEQSFWNILKSRKFWVMVIAIVTAASLFATQQIDGWQFLTAVIASIAAYSTGVAVEDAGAKIGAGKVELNKIPVQPINLTVGMAEPRQNVKQNTSGIMSPPAMQAVEAEKAVKDCSTFDPRELQG